MDAINKMFPERECPVCGKIFIPAPFHAYKDKWSRKTYCSWHCFNHRNDNKKSRKNTRAVEKCTPSGDVIVTYESAKEASERNGVDPQYIRGACKTGTIYKGYIWRYKNDLP